MMLLSAPTSPALPVAPRPPPQALPARMGRGEQGHQPPAPGSPRVFPGAPSPWLPPPAHGGWARNISTLQLSDMHLPLGEGRSGREIPTLYMQRCSALHEAPILSTASGDLRSGKAELLHSNSGLSPGRSGGLVRRKGVGVTAHHHTHSSIAASSSAHARSQNKDREGRCRAAPKEQQSGKVDTT